MKRSGRMLLFQEQFCILGKLVDEETHLRLSRFVVRLQSVERKPFCCAGADGANDSGAETLIKRLRVAHALSHEKQMRDLPCIHEKHNINMTMRERQDRFAQWLYVLWQGPLVN